MQLFTTLTLLAAAVPALTAEAPPAPPADLAKKSAWKQQVFQGCCGTDELVDGNPSTVSTLSRPQAVLLTNNKDTYKGLYILSSGNIITDYDIYAVNADFPPTWSGIIGRVRGARSALTAVNFWDEKGNKNFKTDYLQLNIYGVKSKGDVNNATITINEIWPIYEDEKIHYPPGQKAQPSPAQPAPTATAAVRSLRK